MDRRKLAEIDKQLFDNNLKDYKKINNIKILITKITAAEHYAQQLGLEEIETALEQVRIDVFNEHLAPLSGENLNSPSEVLGD